MDLKPIHIVDTLQVAPADQMRMLELLKAEGVPVMRRAGVKLVGCWSTSPDIEEDVLIQVTWQVADHSAWNLARKEFVTDPGWWTYADKASKLWRGGARRFFYPAPIDLAA